MSANLFLKCKLFLRGIFDFNYECKCGHKAKKKTIISIHGKEGLFTLGKTREYCPICFSKAAIKCAWCGKSIVPEDPITLYSAPEDFKIPDYAVIYQKEPEIRLVGCLRRDCSLGIDRDGFWIMPGKVKRVMSPLEMLYAGDGRGIVIIEDLADRDKATPIKD